MAFAARRADLLDAAGEAESQFRQAQAGGRPCRKYAASRTTLTPHSPRPCGRLRRAARSDRPLGYDDRIYRRKAMAKPPVHALTAQAEHLLTLRETHRLNGIRPYRSKSAHRPPRPHA